MRRRLVRFLPIVVIAVLVQLFAPIGAFRFVANAVSDPLFLATVCNNSGEAGAETSDLSHRHGGCCVACTGIGAAAALDPPIHIVVVLQRRYQRVVWLAARGNMPVRQPGSHAQARAPPSFS